MHKNKNGGDLSLEFSNILKLSGLGAFLGGLMITIVQPWFYYDSGSFIASYMEYMGYILIFMGIFGLYLAQYKEMGNLGLLLFIFLFISQTLWLGYKWYVTFVEADLIRRVAELGPVNFPATIYGAELSLYSVFICLTLFSFVSLWKGIISRIGSSLLLLGVLGGITELTMEVIPYGLFIPHGVIGFSFAWLGWSLFYGKIKSRQEKIMTTECEVKEEELNKEIKEVKVIKENNDGSILSCEPPSIEEKEKMRSPS